MTSDTALTFVIGDPVDHSLSPAIHNPAYHALHLPFHMQKSRVAASELPSFISGLRSVNLAGLAVTMPHKIAIMELLSRIDDAGTAIGAINSVYKERDGLLVGSNTDWLGILRPLERRTSLSGRSVAVIGAGGAALAAVYACTMSGGRVTIFNRSEERAKTLCERWGASYTSLTHAQALVDFEVVINATPLGMSHTSESIEKPLFSSLPFRPHQIVFDTVYAPRTTPLILRASACGATTITGDEMFLEQAMAQFTLHTGVAAPREVMAKALADALG